jgi:hypothetical protein
MKGFFFFSPLVMKASLAKICLLFFLSLQNWELNSFFICSTMGWIQDFALARRALYCCAMPPVPFALVILEIGSHFMPRLARLQYFPTYLGWQVHATALSHWLRWVLTNYFHGLASNCISPDLHIQVARIIGLNRHTQPICCYFLSGLAFLSFRVFVKIIWYYSAGFAFRYDLIPFL